MTYEEIRTRKGSRFVAGLKRRAMKNYNYNPLFYNYEGREYVIFPAKYGKRWWKNAKKNDILRVSVV